MTMRSYSVVSAIPTTCCGRACSQLNIDHVAAAPGALRALRGTRRPQEPVHHDARHAEDERAAQGGPETVHRESLDEVADKQKQDGIDNQNAYAHRQYDERQSEQEQHRLEEGVEQAEEQD